MRRHVCRPRVKRASSDEDAAEMREPSRELSVRHGSQPSKLQCLKGFGDIHHIDQNYTLTVDDAAELRGSDTCFVKNVVRFLSDVVKRGAAARLHEDSVICNWALLRGKTSPQVSGRSWRIDARKSVEETALPVGFGLSRPSFRDYNPIQSRRASNW